MAPLLGPRGAACLQAALIADTIRKVEAISKHAACWLFSTGGNWPEQRGRGRWKLVHQRGRDLGERLERAFRRLLSRHPRAIVIGTDSPLLAPRQLREALSELRVCDAALGPCPDGGFYLVGLRCLPRGFFTGVRWSSRFALRDMLRNLLRSGLGCSVLEPIPDVDCPQDFRVLAAQMGKRRDLRRLSPALWGFVKARHKVRSLAGADRCP